LQWRESHIAGAHGSGYLPGGDEAGLKHFQSPAKSVMDAANSRRKAAFPLDFPPEESVCKKRKVQ
jgi:hypothetical protein